MRKGYLYSIKLTLFLYTTDTTKKMRSWQERWSRMSFSLSLSGKSTLQRIRTFGIYSPQWLKTAQRTTSFQSGIQETVTRDSTQRNFNSTKYYRMISTDHTENFQKIVKYQKAMRDSSKEATIPKISMNKDLHEKFKDFRSKYKVILYNELIDSNRLKRNQ